MATNEEFIIPTLTPKMLWWQIKSPNKQEQEMHLVDGWIAPLTRLTVILLRLGPRFQLGPIHNKFAKCFVFAQTFLSVGVLRFCPSPDSKIGRGAHLRLGSEKPIFYLSPPARWVDLILQLLYQ